MKTSSARQHEFPGISKGAETHEFGSDASATPIASVTVETPSDSANLRVPNFGARGAIYATTARIAGRINATGVSEKEYHAWLDERQALLDKLFQGTLSPRETNRLEYVRWSLDRIEDARSGPALDMLEDIVVTYEKLAADINGLRRDLLALSGKKK